MASLYALFRPLLFLADPETAHRLSIRTLSVLPGLWRAETDPESLGSTVLDRHFPNCLGIAAGFDKNGEAVPALFRLGFGFVEVGTVTPKPQEGNPRPRVFRLPADKAVINRYGFNNDGHATVHARLVKARAGGLPGPLGVNIGANKDSDDPAGDYVAGVNRFADVADYFVVNVSSPNTPGLRALQGREALERLLDRAIAAREKATAGTPLLLKIAPDLSPEAKRDIAAAVLKHGIEGLMVSNTTTARPDSLKSPAREEAGGLSGRPLFRPSTDCLADMYQLTQGRVTLVGTGGVASGSQAYAKIRAGASLVQLYTALVYEGPGLIPRIKRELAGLLARDGFANIRDAVAADHRG